ncbi:MAG TPA: cupin domain-containing protein [Solirubrobacterales bacterium]|nr:cupin domain-containing protein [Solirubrobacterales bacterium]
MKKLNIFNVEFEHDDDDPDAYHSGYVKLAPPIGAKAMAGTLYELPAGNSNCPYHYESDEEWLLVLEGTLTVRHPDGEDDLQAGDLVSFPAGPEGAHKLTNRGEEVVKMLIVSTANMPAVAVYPDSDKIGVFTEDRRDNVMVRRSSDVEYWDGER